MVLIRAGVRARVRPPPFVRDIARESTTLAIETLRTIAADADAPHAARVSAATALLDRAWGKPAQQLSADINAAQTVTINLGWLKGRTVGGFIEHDEAQT